MKEINNIISYSAVKPLSLEESKQIQEGDEFVGSARMVRVLKESPSTGEKDPKSRLCYDGSVENK